MVLYPVHPYQSALLRRMRSRSPASQMPPLGTVVPDRDALALLNRWLDGRPSLPSGARIR